MDHARARALLAAERARLQRLLQAATSQPQAADTGRGTDAPNGPCTEVIAVTEPHEWPSNSQPKEPCVPGTSRPPAI